jgi:hypothetical protein
MLVKFYIITDSHDNIISFAYKCTFWHLRIHLIDPLPHTHMALIFISYLQMLHTTLVDHPYSSSDSNLLIPVLIIIYDLLL